MPSEADSFSRVTPSGPAVHVHKPAGKAGLVDATGKIVSKKFQVHSSFSSSSTNSEVYEACCQDLVKSAAGGQDTFVICYGQTGSGKTYTATSLMTLATSDLDSVSHVSSFELRGAVCSDLLSTPPRNERKVRTDESGTDVVQHLELAPVSSRGEIEALLRTAAEFRSTASTLANPQSSRSHCFTQLHLEGGGSLTFVDLAGAEGKEDLAAHCEMGNAEERLKEMKEINGSLGDLKECIRLNLEKAKGRSARVHVPYRRSLLTRLLRRALDPELQGGGGEGGGGGGHSTTFLAHVAPGGGSQFKGTVNTLNYAEFMVKASREEEERKEFKGPEAWSKSQVVEWVKGLGGEYVALSEVFVLTGKQLHIMWQGDVVKRVIAAGGTEANAELIYNTFRDMVADAKKKARKEGGARRKLGPPPAGFGAGAKGGAEALIYGAGMSGECVENSSKGGNA
ncbi:hypothetical protein TeGR_g12391 [Tetraparma gracilis]|uniref:Kinesin-like protein n=1 Tax=Tetraparma gracilis TaxID=2962635 RepID=A0ABQ6MZ61_9STRA|nr:hypothetical protein TeGR_g12391 [Tetraparma gracilis]